VTVQVRYGVRLVVIKAIQVQVVVLRVALQHSLSFKETGHAVSDAVK
jgi:hypothetical protein